MEGTCNGKYGFILAVLQVVDTGKGLIREGSGSAVFDLRYKCICFKPYKGQVMDVIVTSVNKVRACGGPIIWRQHVAAGLAAGAAVSCGGPEASTCHLNTACPCLHVCRWVSSRRRGPCRCLSATT